MDEAAIQLVQQMLVQQGAALELYARQWCQTPEDVVQEALLRLGRERPLPKRPVAWLYFAVRRGALSAARGLDVLCGAAWSAQRGAWGLATASARRRGGSSGRVV